MRHAIFISSVLAVVLASTFAPLESRSEDVQPTKEGLQQALLSFIVPEAPPEALEAAIAGKKVLSRLIKNNESHARELGFSSAADAADANTHLGRPFAFILISLDKLKRFQPGTDPVSLLIPTPRFLYPITVGNTPGPPLSSLTVIQTSSTSSTDKKWRAVGWGAPQLIRFLATAQHAGHASASSFVVRIEELSRYFLADFKDGKFVIIPLLSEKKYEFVAGTPIQAELAFLKLVTETQRALESKH